MGCLRLQVLRSQVLRAYCNFESKQTISITLLGRRPNNKYYHVKVLLNRFYLNGHIIGFHPQTQKIELHIKKIVPRERTAEKKFHLNGNTTGFHPQSQKLDPRINYRLFHRCEWNNCFIENAHKISRILPDFICKNNRFSACF